MAAFLDALAARQSEGRPSNRRLSCYFFDASAGDSTLLVLPSGKAVLLDCSTGSGGERVARYLKLLKVDKLGAAILSHPDFDHYEGFTTLLEEFPPDVFYHSGLESWTSQYRKFRAKLAQAGCGVRAVRRGQSILLGDGVVCSVLWPRADVAPNTKSLHFSNTNSLVLKIRYGKVSFLFTGDIKSDTEAAMLGEDTEELRADVLKVAHHGSASSSGQAFLEAVKPRVGVILGSCLNIERGAFRRAAPQTLARLAGVGATTLQACNVGTIFIETDGDEITSVMTPGGDVPAVSAGTSQ
jgi:competence protein ComEC